MRTKTLLLTAALGLAGIASSMAQVYSVNAVGYVNTTFPVGGFGLVGNPLNGTNNSVNTILPNAPEGTRIYLFRGGTFEITQFAGGEWDNELTIDPGEGFFAEFPPATPSTLTFVGEVPQGTLVNTLPAGFSLRSSIVPQAGALTAVLGLTPGEGDRVYQFNRASQEYEVTGYSGGEWETEPNIAVAEGFWYENLAGTATWTRTFNVN